MMERTQKQTKNLTEGSPARLILEFAVPMFLGLLFQQFYSMVDTMIVGKFLGMKPLAGVGATGSLNFMVIGFCIGVCNGFAIPVAQKLGAKDYSALRRFVANATWLCLAFSVVMTVIVSILCGDILRFMKTPVIFLALASVLNIGLDLVFIIVFRMGVKGAALATVLAQGISGLCCLWYIGKRFPILRGTKEEWKPLPKYMIRLCAVGIPMGMQYSITAIGTLVIQAAVNGFGSTVVAGVTAATKLGNFVSCPIEALGQTMAPYVGQNMGAGKPKRIGKGLLAASLMGFGVSAVLFVIVLLFGKPMTLLFLSAKEVKAVKYAYQYMIVTTAGYSLLTLVNTVRFTIQGMGYSAIAILAGVFEMAARTLAGTLVVSMIGFMGVCMANDLAWIFADAFLIPVFFVLYRRAKKQYQ